jgi:hypothetical protein
MKKFAALPLVLILALVGCSGGGNDIVGEPDPLPEPVAMNVIETAATVEVGKTFQFHYSVLNSTNTDCAWSLNNVAGGNATLGTITKEGLYTAPASVPNPNQVTVKAVAAADTTKSDTATVTISPQLTISPTSVTLNVGETQQFTTNLPADTWNVNDILWGSRTVGTISQDGLYTAPAVAPNPDTVTVKAWIQSQDEWATATVTILGPTALTVSPSPVVVPAGSTQQFTANQPVGWSLGGTPGTTSSLGSISASGLYTAPLSPPMSGVVTIIATSRNDPQLYATAAATIIFSNASLQGHYAFTYRIAEAGELSYFAGSFIADGHGNITSGIADANQASSILHSVSFNGAYQVTASGLTDLGLQVGPDVVMIRMIMISNTSGRMIGFDDTGTGTGTLEKQDPAAFAAGLSGKFVFIYDGMHHVDYIHDVYAGQPLTAAGQFTAQNLTISNGVVDLNQNGVVSSVGVSGSPFGGSYTNPNSSTGRGTINFNGHVGAGTFSYYLLSADAALLVGTDVLSGSGGDRPVIGALFRRTAGPFNNASFSGTTAAFSYAYGKIPSPTPSPFTPPFPAYSAGFTISDGNGNLTGGLVDNNVNGSVQTAMPVSGTYSVSSGGRGTMAFIAAGNPNASAFYLVAPNTGYNLGTDPWGTGFNQFLPRTSNPPFDVSAISGHYALNVRGTLSAPGMDAIGQIVLDGQGGVTGMIDVNAWGYPAQNIVVAGSYFIDSTGRGTITISSTAIGFDMTMYVQGSRSIFLIGSSWPAVGYFLQQY